MLYGSQKSTNILATEVLDEWSSAFPGRLDVTHVLSAEPEGSSWTGPKGFITPELIAEKLPGPSEDCLIFVCGPPPMYDALCGPRGEAELSGALKDMGYAALDAAASQYRGTKKRIALEVVAFSLEPSQIENLRADFEKFDAEQNGEISVKEFHQVLDSKMSPEEVSKIFESIDLDHTGVVHWHEFLAAAVDTQAVDDAHLRLAFDHLDHDKKGFITPQDVEEIMGEDAKHSEVTQMFSELEQDQIDEKTFMKLCRSQTMERRGTMRSRNTIIMSSPANRAAMAKAGMEQFPVELN